MLQDSNFTYTYDENGNLTSKTSKVNGEVTTYTYDGENQLIRVDKPGVVAEYRYDALGRRIEKVVNGVSTRFVYDNEDIAVEVDGTNTVQAFYLHGPGIDEPLSMGRFGAGGGTSVFHADGLGSITTLTDLNGNPVRTYTYDSFGRIVAQTGTFSNPYTYTGREFDPESELYFYRSRYLDPRSARFTSEDLYNLATQQLPSQLQQHLFPSRANLPGLKTNPQNQNRYPYVNNDPINRIDPFGFAESCRWAGFSGAAVIGIGGQMVFQKGVCTDDCGNRSFKTRNCICASLGLAGTAGVGVERGDTSRQTEGWAAGGRIVVTGSGGEITGFSFGPGAGIFYSWCGCDVF